MCDVENRGLIKTIRWPFPDCFIIKNMKQTLLIRKYSAYAPRSSIQLILINCITKTILWNIWEHCTIYNFNVVWVSDNLKIIILIIITIKSLHPSPVRKKTSSTYNSPCSTYTTVQADSLSIPPVCPSSPQCNTHIPTIHPTTCLT